MHYLCVDHNVDNKLYGHEQNIGPQELSTAMIKNSNANDGQAPPPLRRSV